jgi:transcriptional regulator with XRE-family HTH domain
MEYNGKLFLERLKEVSNNKKHYEIAEDLNVSDETVSRWNNKIPTTDNLLKISEQYNCSIDYLLGVSDVEICKKKNLSDIIRDLFFYYLLNEDRSIRFCSERENVYASKYLGYGEVIFYGDEFYNLFKEFEEQSKAFKYLPHEMRVVIINNLIDKYKGMIEIEPFIL